MIALIENAIIQRLQLGLGQLVREVGSYSGELDDDLPEAIRRFPAAWVTFGGIVDSKPRSASRQQYRVQGQYVVMVGERSLRSHLAGRQGGPGPGEVGSYALVRAVRRLLTEQDLGLAISPLTPGKVRTLFNTRLADQAFSVFACEFACSWLEQALPLGQWPTPPAPDALGSIDASNPDAVFSLARGQTGEADPPLLGIGLNYHLAPDDGQADAQDILRSTP